MNFEDQTKFVQENVKVLATKEYVSDLEKTMKEFRDQKLMIRSSTMDAETKRSMLDMVEQMELQLTANIRTLRKQLSQ
jgi:molybdopterin-biosynthesis enzyme MoeA-like protein